MFLAWFGGAPGAMPQYAFSPFLISLFDAASIVAQDAVLTKVVGALAILFGVCIAARATSRPLLKTLLKQTIPSRPQTKLLIAMFALITNR